MGASALTYCHRCGENSIRSGSSITAVAYAKDEHSLVLTVTALATVLTWKLAVGDRTVAFVPTPVKRRWLTASCAFRLPAQGHNGTVVAGSLQ